MSDLTTLRVLGVVLVVIGTLCLWIGDKEIPVKGGLILRLFSAPRGYMRWMKWPMGAGFIYCGVELLRR